MTQTVQPKVSNKKKESTIELYAKAEEKQRQYCYKPYRNLRNYLQ